MKGFNIPLIVKKIRQSLAIVENGSTASRNIAVGKYVLWKGDLYTVKTAITSGDTLSSTNLDSVSDGGLNSLSSNLNYSTTEQEVGKWIDGRSVYRKVVPLGSEMSISNSTWTNLQKTEFLKSNYSVILYAQSVNAIGNSSVNSPLLVASDSTATYIEFMACRSSASVSSSHIILDYIKP